MTLDRRAEIIRWRMFDSLFTVCRMIRCGRVDLARERYAFACGLASAHSAIVQRYPLGASMDRVWCVIENASR